jgi:ubiquinone/menaquinone biosynthesis C-methylase UbiE/uncharacterized protein YbaR (Trm112 family)
MNLDQRLVELLRCPFCLSGVKLKKTVRTSPSGAIEAAILECATCQFEFPVVEGIPIMMAPHESVDSKFETTALTLIEGPKVADLTAALHANDSVRAFAMLFNPSKLDGDWFPPLEPLANGDAEPENGTAEPANEYENRVQRFARKVGRRSKRALAKVILPHARLRVADYFKVHEASLSALDVIDLYYRQYSGTETYNYFAYRFGQPRHLAALSLASLLNDGQGPVIDLACGLGHMAHYFAASRPDRIVMGMDRDFVRLWIASHFVAPHAFFVCSQADRPLPFADAAVGGIYCSDAFHYFLYRDASVREMRRIVSSEGKIVLACFGNAIEPREGYELSVEGYSKLFAGMPHVIIGEDKLVSAYFERRGPDMSDPESFAALAPQKWLSLVASSKPGALGRTGSFADWPHAIGKLQINPIYKVERRHSNGDVSLRFDFPSAWYKFENESYLKYAPERCQLPAAIIRALDRGEHPPELDEWITKFVVIGMPDRYRETESKSPKAARAGSSPTVGDAVG